MAPKLSPVTGRYVDVEVAGDTYQVFFLENGAGIRCSVSTPPVATTTNGAICCAIRR